MLTPPREPFGLILRSFFIPGQVDHEELRFRKTNLIVLPLGVPLESKLEDGVGSAGNLVRLSRVHGPFVNSVADDFFGVLDFFHLDFHQVVHHHSADRVFHDHQVLRGLLE